MNKNEGIKKTVYGLIALLGAALFVSPIDFLTGIQIDDIGYVITTIVTAYLSYKTSVPDGKNNYQEDNYREV